MTSRLKFLMGLRCCAGHALDEFVVQMPEHRIIGAPQGEEWLVPLIKHFPCRKILFYLAMVGGDRYEGWELAGAGHIGLVRERSTVAIHLFFGELTRCSGVLE